MVVSGLMQWAARTMGLGAHGMGTLLVCAILPAWGAPVLRSRISTPPSTALLMGPMSLVTLLPVRSIG